jgi:lysophospholipase L1-like esterase
VSCLIAVCFQGIALAQNAAGSGVPAAPTAAQIEQYKKQAQDRLLNDFGDLAHYAKANEELLPGSNECRIVFMGDSITEGWSKVDAPFFQDHRLINRGISGQTTPQMLVRFRQDVVALKPAMVHIMGGTNDVAGNTGKMEPQATENNIASMVDIAQASGIAVLLASIPPAAEFPWRRGLEPGGKIAALNAWLRDFARAKHVYYVDYYSPLTDGKLGMKADTSADGVHPNALGYRLMDPLTLEAIQKVAREKRLPHCVIATQGASP